MLTKKQPRIFSHVFVALLVLVMANHCVFEDFFASFAQRMFGIEQALIESGHICANVEHKHDGKSDPHEYCDTHTGIASKPERSGLEKVKLAFFAAPTAFVPYLYSIASDLFLSVEIKETSLRDYPPLILSFFTKSLVFAPQAPPYLSL